MKSRQFFVPLHSQSWRAGNPADGYVSDDASMMSVEGQEHPGRDVVETDEGMSPGRFLRQLGTRNN